MGNAFRGSATSDDEASVGLTDVLQHLALADQSLAARLEAAGLDPTQIQDVRQLDDVAIETKDELVAARQSGQKHWTAQRDRKSGVEGKNEAIHVVVTAH